MFIKNKKGKWLSVVLLILILIFSQVSYSQPPLTTTSQANAASASQKSLSEIIIPNIPGILTGIGGILAAIFTFLISLSQQKKIKKQMEGKVGGGEELIKEITKAIKNQDAFRKQFMELIVERNNIEVIKDRGHFISNSEMEEEFRRCLIHEITKNNGNVLELIHRFGKFVTKGCRMSH
jgi:hypothetical protein